MDAAQLQKQIVSGLRKNGSVWYSSGILVHIIFPDFKNSNEYNIYAMRIHRALQYLMSIDILEKRDNGKFEYKWKSA